MKDFMMGRVTEKAGGGLQILPDCGGEALQKECRLPKGAPALQKGDRVLLLRYGGTYLIAAVYPA